MATVSELIAALGRMPPGAHVDVEWDDGFRAADLDPDRMRLDTHTAAGVVVFSVH